MSPKSCHLERGLGESEASRQTQSKDPVLSGAVRGDARSYRVVVRFFDEQNAEYCHVDNREAAACESPASRHTITTRLNPAL
jgi:hypothetical protein